MVSFDEILVEVIVLIGAVGLVGTISWIVVSEVRDWFRGRWGRKGGA